MPVFYVSREPVSFFDLHTSGGSITTCTSGSNAGGCHRHISMLIYFICQAPRKDDVKMIPESPESPKSR